MVLPYWTSVGPEMILVSTGSRRRRYRPLPSTSFRWLLSMNIWRPTYSPSRFETTAHLWHLWFLCTAYKCTYLLTYLPDPTLSSQPQGSPVRNYTAWWQRYTFERTTCSELLHDNVGRESTSQSWITITPPHHPQQQACLIITLYIDTLVSLMLDSGRFYFVSADTKLRKLTQLEFYLS